MPERWKPDHMPHMADGIMTDSIKSAYQAMGRGYATNEQQGLFLLHFFRSVAGVGEPRPIDMTEREAGFRDGLLHAGMVIANLACLLYTSPSPRDQRGSRMPSSA